MAQVDFYYDYVSPYSYLAYTQLAVLKEAGADVIHHPIFLGGVFHTLGATMPLKRPGAKRASYLFADIARWCRHYGVPMQGNPAFPMSTLPLLRGAGLAQEQGRIEAYSRLAFEAVWVHAKDVSKPSIAVEIAVAAGLDEGAFSAYIQEGAVKKYVKDSTEKAIERGVFGAPTFFVGDSQYFGNDRLHFVLNKLQRVGA